MSIDYTKYYTTHFDMDSGVEIPHGELNIGDTVLLSYRGEERLVLILNPEWEGKLHGISLRNIMPAAFLTLERKATNLNPQAMYRNYDASYLLKKSDSYRTYNLEFIEKITRLSKYNARAFDSGHVFFYKNSVILATDGNQVLAEEYPELLSRIRLVGTYYGAYHPLHEPQNVISSFISRHVVTPRFFKTWEPQQSPVSREDAYQRRVENILTLIPEGGIFFLTLEDSKTISSYLI